MATAAMLEVKVVADTHSATSSLSKFDRKLSAIDRSSATATTRTSALGKASKTTSGHLASAAKYAAGAALAYLSIAQAKAAVTTTQDLAKTTAGLNRNLGFTVKQGSRWAAVAKSRDIDAKSLTMSFTTLSRRVVDAGHAIKEGGGAAETAMQPFSRLGLSQKDVLEGSKNLSSFLPRLADAFGQAEGGAKRQASAQQLLGRGYATVLPLFADGAKGLKEQQQWADKYGATLTNNTLKAQMKEVQVQRESKVAWLGLQVAFTKFVTPALQVANKQFQKITAILADNKLTNAEKFQKIGDIIGKWADKALDAFVGILPSIISRAGEAAPKIAGALVKGFQEAPIWGKLALVGLFASKLGGFRGLGASLGTKFGTSFGGAAGPIAAAGIASFIAGIPVGHLLAKSMGQNAVDDPTLILRAMGLKDGGASLHRVMQQLTDDVGAQINKHVIQQWVKAGTVTRQQGGVMIQALEDVHQETAKLQASNARSQGFGIADAIARDGKLLKPEMKGIFNQFDALPKKGRETAVAVSTAWLGELERMGKVAPGTTAKFTKAVEDKWGDLPKDADKTGKDTFSNWDKWLAATSKNGIGHFKDMRIGITSNVDGLSAAIARGYKGIADMTNKALAAFGVDPVAFAIGKGFDKAQKKQTGGLIVGGTGWGDKVPAMLEPGEVVINRKAVAAAGGASRVNAINSMIPRFAKGGTVPGDVGGLHPGILGLVSSLYGKYGGSVSSGLRAGDTGSLHSTGQAADYVPGNWAGASAAVNAVGAKLLEGIYNPGMFGGSAVSWDTGTHVPSSFWGAEWGNHLDHIHLAIADGVTAAAGRMARDIKRQMLSGPDGPLKSLGQAALDKVRGAANKFIASKAPSGMTGDSAALSASSYKGPLNHVFPQTSTGSPGVALTSSQMNKVRASAGLPSIFGTIAQRESGWHPGIVSFDGGYGLWQITKGASGMDSVIAGMGGYGQMLNPILNAQIAGTMYRSRGLSPWAPSGPYQRGGVIPYAGAFHNGGVVGEGMARVTKGETIRTQDQEYSLRKAVALLAEGGIVQRPSGPGGGGGLPNKFWYHNFKAFQNWASHRGVDPFTVSSAPSAGWWGNLLADYAQARGVDPNRMKRIHNDPAYADKDHWNKKWVARQKAMLDKYTGPLSSLVGGGHRYHGPHYHGPLADLGNISGGAVVGPGHGGRGHGGVGSVTVHGDDQALIDAMAATAQALADLQASIDAQNALTVAVGSSDGYQALRAIADLMSGELGGRVSAIGHTAGAIGSASRS